MLPVAFVFAAIAHVMVLVLVLVTYNPGDEAGQDFLHGFVGIMLFVIGLFFIRAGRGAGLNLPRPYAHQARGLIILFDLN